MPSLNLRLIIVIGLLWSGTNCFSARSGIGPDTLTLSLQTFRNSLRTEPYKTGEFLIIQYRPQKGKRPIYATGHLREVTLDSIRLDSVWYQLPYIQRISPPNNDGTPMTGQQYEINRLQKAKIRKVILTGYILLSIIGFFTTIAFLAYVFLLIISFGTFTPPPFFESNLFINGSIAIFLALVLMIVIGTNNYINLNKTYRLDTRRLLNVSRKES